MEAAFRANQVDKIKTQMMQVMGITDPAEFQRVARDYCKDMAMEMTLPAYMRLFSRIQKLIDKSREKFDGIKKKGDMIAYVLKMAMDDEEVVETFKSTFDLEDQDAKISADLSGQKRTAGNQAFQKKKDQEALNLYSEAVFSSDVATEEGRKDCSLALANRSAVWLAQKKHEECVDDINAAIYFKYPENMLYKLVDRKAKCQVALGQVDDARISYNRVILLLTQSNLEPAKQDVWKKDITAELEKLKTAVNKPQEKKRPESFIKSVNKNVPQLSDAVEVTYNPLVGRHCTASRDIEAGEIVMVDTSLSTRLICGARLTNCAHCMKTIDLTRGKPSPIIVTARFCSTDCLQAAMESYHPVEASINIEKMFWNKKEKRFEEMSGNILLTYRSITQKPLQFFLDNPDYDDVNDMFGVESVCEYSDYRNLFNLAAHRDRKTKDELLSLAIRTAIFLVLLRYGGYMGEKETPYGATMSHSEAHLCGIIFHIQEGIQYNLHCVDTVSPSKMSGITAPQTNTVGSALFPTLLLFNHSCDQNTVRLNINGNQVMMVAKRKIKAGEEVSDNYGIHYLAMTVEERQDALLKGFAFCCWCTACQKDYPRMKSLRTALPENVEDKFDMKRDDIKEMFKKGKHEECLKLSKEMIEMLESAVIPFPHRNYELGALCLLSCLWRLYGNTA